MKFLDYYNARNNFKLEFLNFYFVFCLFMKTGKCKYLKKFDRNLSLLLLVLSYFIKFINILIFHQNW
jgi:hypothetical protein